MTEQDNPVRVTSAVLEAALVALIGEIKTGKTSAAMAAYPEALFIGVKESLEMTWVNSLAMPVDKLKVLKKAPRTLQELDGFLASLEARKAEGKSVPRQIVVDDFSKIVTTTFNKFDESPESFSKKTGNKDAFYAGKKTGPIIERICERSRHLGITVVFIMHEKKPGYDGEGNFRKGGPQTPWRSMGEHIEAWFDINLRVVMDEDSLDPWDFNRTFFCDTGSDWHVGDRSEVCWDKTPGSLYEVMRAGGSRVVRYPGMEWQDEVAETVANALTTRDARSKSDVKATLASIQGDIRGGAAASRHPKHLRWAVQDGIARYLIRARQQQDIFDFGGDDFTDTVNPAGSGESGTGDLPPA